MPLELFETIGKNLAATPIIVSLESINESKGCWCSETYRIKVLVDVMFCETKVDFVVDDAHLRMDLDMRSVGLSLVVCFSKHRESLLHAFAVLIKRTLLMPSCFHTTFSVLKPKQHVSIYQKSADKSENPACFCCA